MMIELMKKIPEPACHVNIRLTSTGSSFKFSIYQRKDATGRQESFVQRKTANIISGIIFLFTL